MHCNLLDLVQSSNVKMASKHSSEEKQDVATEHRYMEEKPVFDQKSVAKETAREAAERGRLATDM